MNEPSKSETFLFGHSIILRCIPKTAVFAATYDFSLILKRRRTLFALLIALPLPGGVTLTKRRHAFSQWTAFAQKTSNKNYTISEPLIINANYISIGVSSFSLNYNMPLIMLLAKEVVFRDHPFSYCKAVSQFFMYPDTITSYDGAYLNSTNGDVFESMESLEEIYLPDKCSFLTKDSFVSSPQVVVYANEGAPVLSLAKSLWLPTNSSDYPSKSAGFYMYLENNGYSGN